MHRLYCHFGMQIKDIVNAYLDGEGMLEIAHREHVSTVKVKKPGLFVSITVFSISGNFRYRTDCL